MFNNIKLSSYSKKLFGFSFLFLYNQIINSKLNKDKIYSYHQFNDSHRKVLLSNETDLFIWGNGKVSNTSIYTNFHPHKISNSSPVKLPNNIIDMSFNKYYATAIDKDFNLYIWKEPLLNSEENPNINNNERDNVIKVNTNLKVEKVNFTDDKIFLLTTDGDVYFYRIIITKLEKSSTYFEDNTPEEKTEIDFDNIIKIKELSNIRNISTGRDHFVALDKEGNVFAMGDDSYGQLGLGNFTKEREQQMRDSYNFIVRRERKPKHVEKLSEKIVKIACGENHTLALSEAGNVYGYGNNRYQQLSHDEEYLRGIIGFSEPTLISKEKFKNYRVVGIEASNNCSFFICKNDLKGTYHFFSCGEGLRGTLGQNMIKHISDIEEIPDISGLINTNTMKPFEPLKLTCGGGHCLLLFKNPRIVFSWGNNESGELGSKDRVFYESPIPMLEEYNLPYKILNICAGAKNSAFICERVEDQVRTELLEKDLKDFEESKSKAKKLKKEKKQAKAEAEGKEKQKTDTKKEDNVNVKSNGTLDSAKQFLNDIYRSVKKYI